MFFPIIDWSFENQGASWKKLFQSAVINNIKPNRYNNIFVSWSIKRLLSFLGLNIYINKIDIKKIKINSNYKFTFDTDVDLRRAELTGYIESYDMVRICVKQIDNGNQVDFPIKTREDYFETVASLNERSNEYDMVEIYQDTHSFDMYDYI